MAPTAKILFWNARSLNSSKLPELINTLTENKIPIALINETHLQKQITVPGYSIYQTNRANQTTRGGTAIIVRDNVQHHQVLLPQLQHAEATAISVTMHNAPVTIIAIYINSNKLTKTDMKKLLNVSSRVIIAGDLNAKHKSWNCHTNTKNGNILYQMSHVNNFAVMAPISPTFYHCNGKSKPDILDIAIIKNIAMHLDLNILDKLDSDHLPVLLTAQVGINIDKPQRRNYKKANWIKFNDVISKNIPVMNQLETHEDIDAAVEALTSCIQLGVEKCVPLVNCNTAVDELPMEIKDMINTRNRYRRLHRRTGDATIKSWVNKLKSLIAIEVQKWKDNKHDKKVMELNTDDHSAWRVTRALTRPRFIIPPLMSGNIYACAPEDKARILADTLQNSFTPNPLDPQHAAHATACTSIVEHFISNYVEESTPKLYSTRQIVLIIHKLKNKKAPGPDEITNEVLKQLPIAGIIAVTKIINAILQVGYFPQQWKNAKVLMFPKPGKKHDDPKNYRPISLLNTLSKVAEKAILIRLNEFMAQNNVLRKEQFGFRSSHSTVQQVVRVVDDITQAINKKECTALILIDLQQAFDRVWYIGLLYKLIKLKVPGYIIKVLYSYFQNRTFYVDINKATSTTRPILAGVPQGSLLGPVLFNIYINDMPSNDKTSLGIYADDTASYASSKSGKLAEQRIQAHANDIADWCKKWRLQVNASKCETMLFRREGRLSYNHQLAITFDGEQVKQVKTAKYLGVTLDPKLSWTAHLEATARKAAARQAQLYPLINPRSKINPNTALRIYKATILPILTYACPVWTGARDKTKIKKLQIVQNKTLSAIAKTRKGTRIKKLHEDLKMPMINEVITKLNEKFYTTSKDHDNPLISGFANSEPTWWERTARPAASSSKLMNVTYYK